MSLHDLTLAACVGEFQKNKAYAEKAFAQLRDEDFFARVNPEQCSIAAYVRHMHGNMLSRWTDFLDSDGEKPTRDRDDEFVERAVPRAELLRLWDTGWAAVFDALNALRPGDLERTVVIRSEPHTVMQAILRQVAHYAWHAGQIVLLAKHIKSARNEPWEYMTIAPGQSQAFNRAKGM